MQNVAGSPIRSFTDLDTWQKGHELVLHCYKASQSFPNSEAFGLTSQLRRSAVSVTSNIAEGFGRPGGRDKARLYDIATGSLYELHSQIIIARDLEYLAVDVFSGLQDLITDVSKLLSKLKKGALAKF